MDYPEALKVVQARKTKENYMLIRFSYDTQIILPYKEGLAFVASLTNAEQLEESYQKPHRINYFNKETLMIRIMSNHEYELYKIAALLNLTIAEVEELELVNK